MAKKLLCVLLSVAMLVGTFALAASAGEYYDYTPETAAEELAEKLWEVDYNANVDYKDLINRTWLTGAKAGGHNSIPETAAPQEILEQNLYFWADEIIEAYNSATTNEEYWALYNKMATPQIVNFEYEDDNGDKVVESDILYEYGYYYRDESKAVMELEIVADVDYVKAGDIITVDVYGTSNFITQWMFGGIFYDRQYLTPLTIDFDEEANPTWIMSTYQLEHAVQYDADGNITFDRRDDYWPNHFQTEENFNKYGVSYLLCEGDMDLGIGNYVYGKKFDGNRIFTATYQVKDDIPDGYELEFFVPEDCVSTMDELLYSEWGDGEDAAIFNFYHLVYEGNTIAETDITVDANAYFDQTVTANVETVVAGQAPTKGEIVSVNAATATIGDTAVATVEVTGNPESLRVVTPDGYQNFTRDDNSVSIEATDAGEIWTIELFVAEAEVACTVYADYGDLGATDGTDFVLIGTVAQDLSIHSIVIPDMYPDAMNGGVITAGKHDIIIKTSTDVVKLQFYAEDGTTYTYTSWSGEGKVPYEDIDGERVWTINHAFGPYGTRSLVIRTRSATTFFAATDSTLDATVVY